MRVFESILNNFDLVPFDVLMIAIWALLFVSMWKILGRVFFAPYLALVEARESATTGAEDSAATVRASAEQVRQTYADRLGQARVQAVTQRLAVVSEAKLKAAKILEIAEGDAQETLRAARWETAQKIDALRTEAFRDADRMAEQITQKLLKPVRPATAGQSLN